MKRHKRLSVKKETSKPSSSKSKAEKEHDLAYYVHDRVELMRQVFSVLSPKEIKAMAPESMRKFSNDEIEEVCLDELLGISSKRVCAVIDGAEPPSDTSSSESEASGKAQSQQLETISVDSVSVSDECDTNKRKGKKKRNRRRSSSKSQSSREPPSAVSKGPSAVSTGPSAGATVLELLELQARARALRSQLERQGVQQGDTAHLPSTSADSGEVSIKGEPPEVLLISSDEEEDRKPSELIQQEQSVEPEPPPPAQPPSCKQKKKKKKKCKAKNTPQTSEELTMTPSSESQSGASSSKAEVTSQMKADDDVLIIDLLDEEPATETSTTKKAKKTTNKKKSKSVAVPQATSRTIQMKSNNVVISVNSTPEPEATVASVDKPVKKIHSTVTEVKKSDKLSSKVVVAKKSAKKKIRKDSIDKDGSDQYEITLQLSDSEKMDLLEDLDIKDPVAPSVVLDSYDSESSSTSNSSESSVDTTTDATKTVTTDITHISDNEDSHKIKPETADEPQNVQEKSVSKIDKDNKKIDLQLLQKNDNARDEVPEIVKQIQITTKSLKNSSDNVNKSNICVSSEHTIDISSIDDIPIVHAEFGPGNRSQSEDEASNNDVVIKKTTQNLSEKIEVIEDNESENITKGVTDCSLTAVEIKREEINLKITPNDEKQAPKTSKNVDYTDKLVEEGEVTDSSDSEVEVFEVQPEVVCISDEDSVESNNATKKKSKKNKKEKKHRKCKKHRQPTLNVTDQNLFQPQEKSLDAQPATSQEGEVPQTTTQTENVATKCPDNIDSDVCEILDLSDDSSCYEVEGVSVSKEPTSEEIEALSAKIDEIERVDVLTGEQVPETEQAEEDPENISWKDRYLESKKVKKVLSTSNILNAMRKKNKELKLKMLESKKIELEIEKRDKAPMEVVEVISVEEGSIEQFNLLEGSTKFVDPVLEAEKNNEVPNIGKETASQLNLTNQMKRDAKQLLKMYKRLLKYNSLDKPKPKDPNKKKKSKKQKKKKDRVAGTSAVTAAIT